MADRRHRAEGAGGIVDGLAARLGLRLMPTTCALFGFTRKRKS
jgi:hypothetical protein